MSRRQLAFAVQPQFGGYQPPGLANHPGVWQPLQAPQAVAQGMRATVPSAATAKTAAGHPCQKGGACQCAGACGGPKLDKRPISPGKAVQTAVTPCVSRGRLAVLDGPSVNWDYVWDPKRVSPVDSRSPREKRRELAAGWLRTARQLSSASNATAAASGVVAGLGRDSFIARRRRLPGRGPVANWWFGTGGCDLDCRDDDDGSWGDACEACLGNSGADWFSGGDCCDKCCTECITDDITLVTKCQKYLTYKSKTGQMCKPPKDSTAKLLGICDSELQNVKCMLEWMTSKAVQAAIGVQVDAPGCQIAIPVDGPCTWGCPQSTGGSGGGAGGGGGGGGGGGAGGGGGLTCNNGKKPCKMCDTVGPDCVKKSTPNVCEEDCNAPAGTGTCPGGMPVGWHSCW